MLQNITSDRPREECGVCGIFGHEDSAKLTYFGLYALQHRGQESAGIVSSDGEKISQYRGMGLVPEVFSEEILQTLVGKNSIGHVRYSTTGESNLVNAQPFTANHLGCTLSVAHNGNLVNIRALREELEKKGSIFQSTMDSEAVVHLLARSSHLGFEEAILSTMSEIKGAFSMVLLTEEKLVAIRDPNGFRPLCLGQLNNGGYIVFIFRHIQMFCIYWQIISKKV